MDDQYNMGVCYERGMGVEKDMALARKWYRKAAAQGDEMLKAVWTSSTQLTR